MAQRQRIVTSDVSSFQNEAVEFDVSKNPILINQVNAIGISLPFNTSGNSRTDSLNYASGSLSGNSVFLSTYTTKDSIISNLTNFLLTRKGERFMQPRFGTTINEILFENNVKEIRDLLKETLRSDINYWLPYIELQNVSVSVSKNNEHILDIKLFFRITSFKINLVVNILANENSLTISNINEINV